MANLDRPPRILFAGGGTGGHVYPAIAIADALVKKVPDAAIAFAGTRQKIEWRAVPKAGYPIHPITIQGFHRGNMSRNVTFPFKLIAGLTQSWSLVGAFDPDVVVGTGGYVSGPVLYAAHKRKRPVVIQEQNALPGITNKLLGKFAHTVHIAFEDAKNHFGSARCILSGNPTRNALQHPDIEAARDHFSIPESASTVFMFGGSLGSAALNRAMESMIQSLLENEQRYVIWQTGAIYYDALSKRIPEHPRLRLLKYIERMDYAYAIANLVLARAGAITCSELTVTGKPSVLVPSPNVAEDHQTKNAQSLEREGAAICLAEKEMNASLYQTLVDTLQDTHRLQRMREAARRLARPDAADAIAQSIVDMIT